MLVYNNVFYLSISEAGMLLVDIEPFNPALFDGYVPMGHRGMECRPCMHV